MTLTADERTFVYQLFLETESPSQIFQALYARKKLKQPHFSIAAICKACQIPSRGYLSEFLNGKRRLNERYRQVFVNTFGLTGRLAEAGMLTFALDEEEADDQRLKLRQKLNSLRKSFIKVEESFPSKLQGMVFAAEVYCAFGLFKNRPTRQQLKEYFGRAKGIDVDYALSALRAIDVIGFDEASSAYFMKENTIRFTDSDEDGLNYDSFHLHAIADAEQGFKTWSRTKDAYFETMMLSIQKSRLQEFLEKIKDHSILAAQDMESTDGDLLIRFNVQIYPMHGAPIPNKS